MDVTCHSRCTDHLIIHYGISQHGQPSNGNQGHEDGHDCCEEVDGEKDSEEDQELTGTPRVFANPALDKDSIQPYVTDLYYAVAHPRFAVDPVCLRRRRGNACAAAGGC